MIALKLVSIISVVAVFLLLASVIQNRAWAPTAVEYNPPEFQLILAESNDVVKKVIVAWQAQGYSLQDIENRLQTVREFFVILGDALVLGPSQVAPSSHGGKRDRR